MSKSTKSKTPKEPIPEPIKTTYTDRLCELFTDETYDQYDICKMIREFSLSETAKKRADTSKMSFGKFKGKSIKEIVAFDKQYLVWLNKQTVMENFPELKANIQAVLK